MRSLTSSLNDRYRFLSKPSLVNNGKCVIYVMNRDQRVSDNHALFIAQEYALEHKVPLLVVFVLSESIAKGRARQHLEFMIEGLKQLEAKLYKLNIPFILLIGAHTECLKAYIAQSKPLLVVVDFNPLKGSILWQNYVAKIAPTIQVDTHNSVPAWIVSNKQEIGARTLRPKLHSILDKIDYNEQPLDIVKHPYTWPQQISKMNDLQKDINKTINSYLSNGVVYKYKSGEEAAKDQFNIFLNQSLKNYSTNRNDPTISGQSNLSPYLHFGQISSLYIYKRVKDWAQNNPNSQSDVGAFLEELLVRKELSENFCLYNNNYSSIKGAPEWAQKTLKKHENDIRPYLYSLEQLQNAQTHDEAWNAAQRQLLFTGKIHGYMRMYWAKKVLEWSISPEEALKVLIYLNDFYSIDGGDPNGYAGILWSVAGLHDRPWGERPIYGLVRSMVYNGLKRKFNVLEYQQQWQER